MIAVFNYLFKDSLSRWREQPISPLARVLIVWVLVSTSLVILLAFFVMEREVEKRLLAIGSNVVVIQETISTVGQNAEVTPFAKKMEQLDQYGKFHHLKKYFNQGITDQNQRVSIYQYDNELLRALSYDLEKSKHRGKYRAQIFYLNDRYPSEMEINFKYKENWLSAQSLPLPTWAKKLEPNGMLWFPKELEEQNLSSGYILRSILEIEPNYSTIEIVEAIHALQKKENNHRGLRVDDPSHIIKESQSLKKYQLIWRTSLSAIFGTVLCIVFLAIGWLEYRQSKYVGALLISMGTPKMFIRAREVVENTVLANLGFFLAFFCLLSILPYLMDSLGMRGSSNILFSKGFLLGDGLLLLLMVNFAAWTGSLASWIGVSQDEGYTLS